MYLDSVGSRYNKSSCFAKDYLRSIIEFQATSTLTFLCGLRKLASRTTISTAISHQLHGSTQ